MPKTSKPAPTADEIAAMAGRGEDECVAFTNGFTVVHPEHLETLIAEGLQSRATEMTAQDWEDVRAEGMRQLNKRREVNRG